MPVATNPKEYAMSKSITLTKPKAAVEMSLTFAEDGSNNYEALKTQVSEFPTAMRKLNEIV